MFPKALSIAAVALAASGLVSAQTFTECNPLKKTCPADKAFSGKVTCDFTKGECDTFSLADGTTLKYDGKGATFAIEKESNAPTIHTGKYIFFGRIDVVVQAADGQGIVTSAVLQSDDLDEIDWEWVGGDNAQVQTNYFSKGDTTTYDRGAYHPVDNPLGSYHKYTVEWTSTAVNWLIDDNVVRTLTAADAKGGEAFPQTPMQVKLGTWVAGGKDSAEGTVEWAGGYTDFTKAPFNAYYKSITIVDYAGTDAPCKEGSVEEYTYGDNSGSWESIVVKKSDGSSDDDTTTTKSSASKTATKTAEETSTKSATKTESASATESETKTKTESEKETKTSAAHTTFTTAAATTDSGSSPSKTSGGSTPTDTTAASGTAEPTVSTVPASGASRMAAGSLLAAVAGLLVAQLL
ncbi:Fc.00g061000.m01.CDS01 [Cosmosporella sp. VM-42]